MPAMSWSKSSMVNCCLAWLRLIRLPAPWGAVLNASAHPLPPDRVAAGAHGAGYKAHLTLSGFDGSLAGNEHRFPHVDFPLAEVVVALDGFDDFDLGELCLQDARELVHHLGTVEEREVLCPQQVGLVLLEGIGACQQVCEVRVRQPVAPLGRFLHGHPDVMEGDVLADSPGSGVQESPDAVGFVEYELDEVVFRSPVCRAGYAILRRASRRSVAACRPVAPVRPRLFVARRFSCC